MSHQKKRNIFILRALIILAIITTWYAVTTLQKTSMLYDRVAETTAHEPVVATKAQIDGLEVTIPSYDLFKSGNIWSLVSKQKPLSSEASYTLIDIPVAHGDEDLPMKIADDISDELQQLVNAAEADNEPLMVSSAYRSLAEQKEIYDEFVAESGETVAKQYVSPVGASEHHTGLSVDFSNLSDECAKDSDSCSLSQSGAAWLAENASRFGFIQRYPEDKQSTTGVAYEPWHFRFIGKPLAKVISQTDLTYDEVVEQLAPGYAKAR